MTERLDFAALYRELELVPGCSPAQLRAAYRRRVSRLHPDQGGSPENTGRLQQLNRLYRAALEFERAHGRLPGAGSGATASEWPDTLASAGVDGRGPLATAPAQARERIPRSFLLVVIAAVCVLLWRVLADMAPALDASAEPMPAPHAANPAATHYRSAVPHDGLLAQGMRREAVLDIQGEPLDRRASRWLYGPSWVEFACDRVVDWYSSPLQPLRVRMERPKAGVREACAP